MEVFINGVKIDATWSKWTYIIIIIIIIIIKIRSTGRSGKNEVVYKLFP